MYNIKLWLLNWLMRNHQPKKIDKQIRDSHHNWVRYCYGNKGFEAYCDYRVDVLRKSVTAKIQDRDQYVRDLAAIEEVIKMRVYITEKFKKIEQKEKKNE